MDAIETFEKNGYTITLHQDDNPESPREWDNLGKMICFHNRYDLGDKHDLQAKDYTNGSEIRAVLEARGAAVILPLFLYDHSGLRIKVGSFQGLLPQGHAEFDSGQIGFIVAYRKDILKEFSVKRITKALLAQVEDHLRSEVDTYDQFLRGDIYGYCIEDKEGGHVDSCWGIFGLDKARKDANEAVPAVECPPARPKPLEALKAVAEDPGKGWLRGETQTTLDQALARAEKR